ncbi:MAG TPA: TonB-dependent receptor [Thermoanaerobaculia bacterium]|nr:TonB-dependent receptor [Thermoanaerobaculia bacterium]
MAKLFRSLILLLCLAAIVTELHAHGPTGTLTGVVRVDRRALPGVLVTVSSSKLQSPRTSVTDPRGRYTVAFLPAGEYMVSFEKEGLQTVARPARVGLRRVARVDMKMNVPEIAEAITITATAPAIVELHEVQTNFDAEFIDSLPVSRSLQSTAALAPGVHNTGPGASERRSVLAISGAPSFDSLYLIDGTVVNENVRGQAHALYIEDAIDETTILTGAISAEYGRFTGGVVSTVTKSGGNEYSGSLRDNLSNPAWSSRRRGSDHLDRLNQVIEATLGGRIQTDRLWFFTAGRWFSNETESYLAGSTIPYVVSTEENRFELKLTGQLAADHALVLSHTSVDHEQLNNCQVGCMELSAVDTHVARPNSFSSLRYNGMFGRSVLVSGTASQKKFAFEGFGGESRDPATGSWGFDASGTGAFFGAPYFCGVCDDQERNSENYSAKLSHYFESPRLGTHEIVGGLEHWAEESITNNYQSASDFGVVTHRAVERDADGVLRPRFEPGSTFIIWYPIFVTTDGTDFTTSSLFLNDRWSPGPRWSFNLGARYDYTRATNGSGVRVADDAEISPRIAATFDPRDDGRLRFNTSFSRYVTKLAGTIGDLGSPAGNPSYFSWQYAGPVINEDSSLTSFEAMAQLFDWFVANGGTSRPPDGVAIPGLTSAIQGKLQSPSADEWTIGVSAMVGRNGFMRADVIDRQWRNFYSRRTDLTTGRVDDGFGQSLDRSLIENTNDLTRSYRALQLQGGYRIYGRFNLGGNYTWSRLEGNAVDESIGSGPIPNDSRRYPEYRSFDRSNPIGLLSGDQTHKVRLWAEVTLPSMFGELSVSFLQRFDSGSPYEVKGTVRAPRIENPGYVTPPLSVPYYFSDRGALRWDDVTSSDLAFTFALPIRRTQAFLQADVINLFDESAQVRGNTTVHTDLDGSEGLESFDLFTQTPVEGVHYRKGKFFGRARSIYDYQQPRTFRLSAGVRF